MPLTGTGIKNAKRGDKTVRLFDGGGLYLEASPAGCKWWRLKYRFGGKGKFSWWLSTAPNVSTRQISCSMT